MSRRRSSARVRETTIIKRTYQEEPEKTGHPVLKTVAVAGGLGLLAMLAVSAIDAANQRECRREEFRYRMRQLVEEQRQKNQKPSD